MAALGVDHLTTYDVTALVSERSLIEPLFRSGEYSTRHIQFHPLRSGYSFFRPVSVVDTRFTNGVFLRKEWLCAYA